MLGSGLIIIGSFLPWFVMTDGYNNQMTMSGLEGDGVYTIILGILALLAAVSIKYQAGKNVSGGGTLFGGLAGLIAIYDIFYSYGLLEEAGNRFSLSVQWGLPLIILGGGLALFTGLAKFPE